MEAAWAIFQHRASRAVLQELRASGTTIDDLAEKLGDDPAWLQRKLHGQTPVDLGDVMAWALEYGVHIIPVFDESSEMKPSQS
jgi:transcriptional regulator with XRE-family HTH domain